MSTVKFLKIGTPGKIITIIFLKLEQFCFTMQLCFQKDPNGMANSVDPD